jgi:predicted RNase H-like HicB family nuclease|tara:strand:+ start:737 stop:2626 length:1890 start_codon:yes stop_codon:yes gene_type:complete
MATIQSTKPGDITGSSVLTGRTPSYRLVLKVDPQTGQYKYEYEVDDAPKAVDTIVTPPPAPASGTGGDSGAEKPKGEEGSGEKKDPVSSFEQTKAALAGREPSGEGPLGQRESNFKPDDRNFGQMALDSETARRRNLGLAAINPVFGLLGTVKTMDDRKRLKELGISTPVAREQIADIYGKAIKAGKTPQEALREATISGGVALTDQAFEDAGVPELSINKQLEDFKAERRTGPSFDDSAIGKSTFDQTVDALGIRDTRRPDALDMDNFGAVTDATRSVIGSTIDDQIRELENQLVGKTGKTKTRLTQELNSLKEQKTELEKPTKVFTGTPKQQQQKKGPFDLVTRESVTPTKRPDQPTVADNRATISEARSNLSEAISSRNVTAAMDAAKTVAGFSGLSRDKAQQAMDQAAANAASYGGAKTGKDKRGVENSGRNDDGTAEPGSVAAQRDALGKTTAEKSRSVDRDNALGNKARANEVSDRNGNAVTNNGKAINFGGPRRTKDNTKEGNQGGKSTRIICSELYRQGLISKEDYVLDLYYTSKYLTEQHTAGYWHFAVPAVKAMRLSKFWTAFWKEIAYNRLQDIKWRLGEGKFNLRGRIYSAVFEPFCYISGYFTPNATYNELYEGEQ